ncbi:MAG: glycosyltransferase [Bacteroidetes bacterium]|nr:glycosyltransferase [Bacteroidota bacterium]
MKIAACVIVYHGGEKVIQNIRTFSHFVDKLYFIDNTETKNILLHSSISSLSNINIIHDGFNEGIAKRLNQACALAINDGFDFLLTMDQDSFFDEKNITQYLECIKSLNEHNFSMSGINYQQQESVNSCDCREVKLLITSGSIINLAAFKVIGKFDENLFIDFVDTEYCFRSIRKGFKIIEFPNIYMHHHLGTVNEKYSLKTFTKTSRTFHSATRLYYMYRNFLYLQSEYKNDFKNVLTILKKDLFNRIKNKLLYTPNRISAIKILLKAKSDFKKNMMGKLPD